jgi:hypothetical protein
MIELMVKPRRSIGSLMSVALNATRYSTPRDLLVVDVTLMLR